VTRLRDSLAPAARDLAAALLLRTGLTRPARAAAGRLTVVTFHRVLPAALLRDYPLPEIAVTVEELAWFVGFFREHYSCGTLAETHARWVAGQRPARPLLAITFDDGQLDNLEHAVPVLERAGLRATFFAPLDAVDGNAPLWHDRLGYAAGQLLRRDRGRALRLFAKLGPTVEDDHRHLLATMERTKRLAPEARLAFVAQVEAALGEPPRPAWDGLMSWDQLRGLAGAGHEVGSHSFSHAILPLVDDAQLEREVAGSRRRLEAELGRPCESFCYPNGDCDDRVAEAVRRAGYRRAVTTTWGANGPEADAVRLRRCDMQGARARTRGGALSPARLAMRLHPRFPGGGP
jgi:peptidoglycan/xylan/chitin deacetylase (PgdA/CDA1 family)